MIRLSLRAVVAVIVLVVILGGQSPSRAEEVAVAPLAPAAPRRFALSLAGGSGAAPQGHLGLRFAFRHGRFEAAAGLGVFVGDDPRTEEAAGESPTKLTHLVPSLGAHYVVLRRTWVELAPGLGLSLHPVHLEETTTRPSYDPVHFTWQTSTALRLDVELEARFPLGSSWFASVVAGWGIIVAGLGDCAGVSARFSFSCRQPPSPAYAAPTPIAGFPYGQLVSGWRF